MVDAINIIKLKCKDNNPVKYIYHTADIHIRLHQRHSEYREVFDKLYKVLRAASDEAILVVCGDILHSKTELSPECIQLTMEFFKSLCDILPVVVIPGNHDMLTNRNRLDALTPLLSSINGVHPLHYLFDSGIYRYKNLTFGVSCFLDKTLVKAKDIKCPGVKIALYHGAVHGALTEVGYRMNSDEYTAESFVGYDMVLLGDIHRFQFMGDRKQICYPSSLIQQNYAESLNNHGVVKWDVTNRQAKLIPVENDYGFVTLNINKGELTKEDKKIVVPKRPSIRFILKDTDTTLYQKLCKLYYDNKDYDVQNIRFTNCVEGSTDVADDCIDANLSHNINQLSYQNKRISMYAKELYPDIGPPELKRLIDINKELYKELDTDTERRVSKWKLLELKFSNMFCYGNGNTINFRAMGNKIYGLLGSNGTGKSSILEILLFTLFDKHSKGDRLSALNRKKTKFSCQVTISIADVEYVIKRKVYQPKPKANLTTQVSFIKLVKTKDKTNSIVLDGKDRVETNKIIASYIGTYDDYIMTSLCLQKGVNFIDYPQARKKDFLMKLLRLDIFERLLKLARTRRVCKEALYKDLLANSKDVDRSDLVNKITCMTKELKKLEIDEDNYKRCNLQLYERLESIVSRKIILDTDEDDEDKLIVDRDKLKDKISDLEESIKKDTTKFKKYRRIYQSTDESDIILRMEVFNKDKKINIDKIRDELKSLYRSQGAVPRFDNDLAYYKKGLVDADLKLTSVKDKISKERIVIEELTNSIFNTDKLDTIKVEYKQWHSLVISLEQINAQIDDMQNKLSKLKNHKYDPNCKFCVSNEFVKDAIETSKHLQSVLKDKAKLDKSISKLGNIEAEYTTMMNKVEANSVSHIKIESCKHKLDIFNRDLKTAQEIRSKWVADVDEYRKGLSAIKEYKRSAKKISQLEIRQNMLEDETFSEYTEYTDAKNSYLKLKQELDNYSIILSNLKTNAVNTDRRLEVVLKNKQQRDINIKNKDKITKIKDRIKVCTVNLEDTQCKLEDTRIKIKLTERDLERCINMADKRDKLSRDIHDLSRYIKIMDKNGLPCYMLNNILPSIQNQVNKILLPLVKFSVDVEISSSSSIDISKVDGGSKYPVELCSGMEQFMVGIALRIALTQVNSLSSGNFIMIDEGFSSLDSDNRGNLDSLFTYLKSRFDFVLVVSHVQALKGMCDETIDIDLKDGMSRIKFGV